MNGPENYREAGELLDYVYNIADRDGAPLGKHEIPTYLARAQVHATLAVAAATVLAPLLSHYGLPEDIQAWLDATCTPEAEGETEDQADEAPDDPAQVDGALDRIAGHVLAGNPYDQNGGAV